MKIIDADAFEKYAWGNPDIEVDGEPYISPSTVQNFAADHPITIDPPNDPLTIEQLREMDGEPVWVETIPSWLNGPKKCEWVIVSWNYDEVISTSRKTYLRADDYGDAWIAYRRPPEGEA